MASTWARETTVPMPRSGNVESVRAGLPLRRVLVLARRCLSRARYEDTGQTYSRPLQGERPRGAEPARWVVRKGGLEPPRLAAPAPKAGASANSATFAISARQRRSAHLKIGRAHV